MSQPFGAPPAVDLSSTGRDSFCKATDSKAGHTKRPWAVSREAFDRLLDWLGPDREASAQRYERIRATLIRIFEWRGARNCEEFADETFDRATRRLEEGAIREG